MSSLPQKSRTARRLPLLRWLRRSRFAIILVFGILVFWLIVSPWARRIRVLNEFFYKLEYAENSSLDLRFRWRGAQSPDPNIVIVGVTKPYLSAAEVPEQELKRSEALRAMGERDFPWRRVVWIEVLDRLFASGARVVVFDIVFGRQTEDDPAFAAALQKYRGKIVLAMTVDAKEDSGQLQLRYPHPGLLGESPKEWIGCAAVHKETADDETIRRIDHFTSELREYGLDDTSNEIPGLAAFAVEKFSGKPVTAGQRRLIRYQGPRETYDYLPVHELLDVRMVDVDDDHLGRTARGAA